MTLVEVRHLSKAFPIEGGIFRRRVGAVQALRDVSFQLGVGETLAIVGASGCGKSTLARIVAGLTTADAGDVLWKNESMNGWPFSKRAPLIQMVFQDPYASLNPKLSVGAQLREAVTLGGDGARADARCVELLESTGLSGDALQHYPFQFSGGQRQRIAIARALALKPQLLIADEPLSALDVTIQVQILELFRRLKGSLVTPERATAGAKEAAGRGDALSLLFITHDLAVAREVSDRVLVLKDGQKVEEGSTAEVLSHPQNDYTQALLNAVPALP